MKFVCIIWQIKWAYRTEWVEFYAENPKINDICTCSKCKKKCSKIPSCVWFSSFFFACPVAMDGCRITLLKFWITVMKLINHEITSNQCEIQNFSHLIVLLCEIRHFDISSTYTQWNKNGHFSPCRTKTIFHGLLNSLYWSENWALWMHILRWINFLWMQLEGM